MDITRDTELRHIPQNFRMDLGEMLDMNDGWKRLAGVIRNPDNPERLQYTAAHINTIEQQARQQGKSPATSLLSDWETRGRVSATVRDLLDVLNNVRLHYAADYVKVNILGDNVPTRPGADPAAPTVSRNNDSRTSSSSAGSRFEEVDRGSIQSAVSDPASTQFSSNSVRVADQESGGGDNCGAASVCRVDGGGILDTGDVRRFSHAQLSACTNGFAISLGRGAFGEVYWGELLPSKTQIAVKKLSFDARAQFTTELHIMARFRHPNLLPLLGYSDDDVKACCLVSPFMANGSLEDRLAQKNGTSPLTWQTRVDIAIGTAKGIVHLHTSEKEHFVHRDIKSANILLDDKFHAKVGDFGITRIGGDWQKTTQLMTSNVSGTPVYMSYEAVRGSVTVKMDTWSFGIVMLELLTGLAPFDPTRENHNLLDHVVESDDEMCAQKWQDPKAGDWPKTVVERFLDLALRSTEITMKLRPLMQQVLQELEEIARQVQLL